MLTQKQIDSRPARCLRKLERRARKRIYLRVVHITRDYWGKPKDGYEVVRSLSKEVLKVKA